MVIAAMRGPEVGRHWERGAMYSVIGILKGESLEFQKTSSF